MRIFLICIALILQSAWFSVHADQHAKIASLPEDTQRALDVLLLNDDTVRLGAISTRGSSLFFEDVVVVGYDNLVIDEFRIESMRRESENETSYFSIRLTDVSLIDEDLGIELTAETILLEKPSQFVAQLFEKALIEREFQPFTFEDDLQYRRVLIEGAHLKFTKNLDCSIYIGRWTTNNLNKLELASSFLDDASLNCMIEGAPLEIRIENNETKKITFGEYPNLLLHHVLSFFEFNGTGKLDERSPNIYEAAVFAAIKNMYFSTVGSLGVTTKSSPIGFNLLGIKGVIDKTSSKVVSRRRGASIETSDSPLIFTMDFVPSEYGTVDAVTKYLSAADAKNLYVRMERAGEYDVASDTLTIAPNDNSIYLHESLQVNTAMQIQGVKAFVESVEGKLEREGTVIGKSVSDVIPDDAVLLVHQLRIEIQNLGVVDQVFRVAGYLTGDSPDVLRTQTAALIQIAPITSAKAVGVEQAKLADWAYAVGQFFHTPGVLTLELQLDQPINVFDLDEKSIVKLLQNSLVVNFIESEKRN